MHNKKRCLRCGGLRAKDQNLDLLERSKEWGSGPHGVGLRGFKKRKSMFSVENPSPRTIIMPYAFPTDFILIASQNESGIY